MYSIIMTVVWKFTSSTHCVYSSDDSSPRSASVDLPHTGPFIANLKAENITSATSQTDSESEFEGDSDEESDSENEDEVEPKENVEECEHKEGIQFKEYVPKRMTSCASCNETIKGLSDDLLASRALSLNFQEVHVSLACD